MRCMKYTPRNQFWNKLLIIYTYLALVWRVKSKNIRSSSRNLVLRRVLEIKIPSSLMRPSFSVARQLETRLTYIRQTVRRITHFPAMKPWLVNNLQSLFFNVQNVFHVISAHFSLSYNYPFSARAWRVQYGFIFICTWSHLLQSQRPSSRLDCTYILILCVHWWLNAAAGGKLYYCYIVCLRLSAACAWIPIITGTGANERERSNRLTRDFLNFRDLYRATWPGRRVKGY